MSIQQKQLVGLLTEQLALQISNPTILSYKPSSSGVLTGKVSSLGRVFNFIVQGNTVSVKPSAGRTDSVLFSRLYLAAVDRLDAVRTAKQLNPNCGAKSYRCKGDKGVGCIPVTNHCRRTETDAISTERLSKIRALTKELAASGGDATKLSAAEAAVKSGRQALAEKNRSERTAKKMESESKPKRQRKPDMNRIVKDLTNWQAEKEITDKQFSLSDAANQRKFANKRNPVYINGKQVQTARKFGGNREYKVRFVDGSVETIAHNAVGSHEKDYSFPISKSSKKKVTFDSDDDSIKNFFTGLTDALKSVAPVTRVVSFKINPDKTISGIFATAVEQFRYKIDRNGGILTKGVDKSTSTRTDTDGALNCGQTRGSRRCGGACIPSDHVCHNDPTNASKAVVSNMDRILANNTIDQLEAKLRDYAKVHGKTKEQTAQAIAKARTMKGKPTTKEQVLLKDKALNEWTDKFNQWDKSGQSKQWIRTEDVGSDGYNLIQGYIRKGNYTVDGSRIPSVQLASIQVSEDVRGQGIFSNIIKHIEKNHPEKALVIEVAGENSSALAKKNGFVPDPHNHENWIKKPKR